MHPDGTFSVVTTIVIAVLYAPVGAALQYQIVRLCFRSTSPASFRLILTFSLLLCVLPGIGYVLIHNYIGAILGFNSAALGTNLAIWEHKRHVSK